MTILVPLLVALGATGAGGRPQVGDLAPDFKLPGSTGEVVSLAEYRGKKPVILAFFPKAFTPG